MQKSLSNDLGYDGKCSSTHLESFQKLYQWCHSISLNIILFAFSTIYPLADWSKYYSHDAAKWLKLAIGAICPDLFHQIVDDSYLKSVLVVMAHWMADEPSVSIDKLTSIHLINALVQPTDGAFTFVGGIDQLRQTLLQIIYSMKGLVITDVPLHQFVVNDKNIICGVACSIPPHFSEYISFKCSNGVISGVGVINTFAKLLPVSFHPTSGFLSIQSKLKKIEERRPKMWVVFWLNGTTTSLGLKSCEYFEYFNQESETLGGEHENEVVSKYCHIWSPSSRDPSWNKRSPKLQTVVVEMEAGGRIARRVIDEKYGYHYYIPVGVISSQIESIITHAKSVLRRVYQLVDNQQIDHVEYISPFVPTTSGLLCGCSLSSTHEKFLSKFASKTDFPGLFLCGPDISVPGFNGNVLGGVSAACAVLDYSPAELASGRNIISDLDQSSVKINGQI